MPTTTPTTHITCRNGDQVKVNDHVYCSPGWSVRDGTPYSVARIMEFLPAQGTPTFDANGNRNEPFTRVRLAWYYRPGDVSDRTVADCRLLLAAIYSEVCDISQLRSRCHVLHRDKISDLAGWKKRPDRFYYTRLFDPWIRKDFEIIQTTSVRNLPENIRETLVSRYEYIVTEREIVPDLTDTIRNCAVCEKWCPPSETVQCDRCKNFFHMLCNNPPLLAKPSRGYGWTCAPCSREHEQEVEGHELSRHHTPIASKPKSNAPAPRGRGRPRKDRSLADKEESVEIKHFKMWPFRYFGLYTIAEDTLDPDDLIFPRAASRIGPKFQATTLPPVGSENDRPPDIEERGGDSTIEVYSLVNEMSPEEVATMETYKNTLTRSQKLLQSVDWLTEVIFRFTDAWVNHRDMATVSMQSVMRKRKWATMETRYTDREWSTGEKAAFEEGIMTYGAELRPVKQVVGLQRTMPEVVRYYGHWKNMKLGEENRRIKLARLSGLEAPPDNPVSGNVTDDDDSSIIMDLPSGKPTTCGACRTRESEVWWKGPKGNAEILCENCSVSWRKYADINVRSSREETVVKKTVEKREGTPLTGPVQKRPRTTSRTSTPPVPQATAQIKCTACHKNGPMGKVLRCKQCHFRVHAGTCGAVFDATSPESWLCDLCQNDKTQDASVIPDCLLCPRTRKDPKKKGYNPPADSYLRACKPTEGQAWVHAVCSVFIPEVSYTDATKLKLVEGISTIPLYRWMNKCTLCDQEGGAVVKCSDCPAEYHVSCAWKANHKFGFELQPVKANRKDSVVVTFKGHDGYLAPIVTCKGHPPHHREQFDICDMNEHGETSLQVYCKNYKQAPTSNMHHLLRKAHRLDQIINTEDSADSESTQSFPEPTCSRCRTEFSPCFYPVSSSTAAPSHSSNGSTTGQNWLCHKCHMQDEVLAAHPILTNGKSKIVS
ncbi:hypothetical protein C8Q75DRAFT_610949 [Abortiporus biennis]|nr:hypothetical protein C8Q75DRAFT_610949 [Abortiporus biennis]